MSHDHENGKYVLTFVRADGTSRTTTADGYFAEDMMDRAFDRLIEGYEGSQILFATVIDYSGSIRHIYVKEGIIR